MAIVSWLRGLRQVHGAVLPMAVAMIFLLLGAIVAGLAVQVQEEGRRLAAKAEYYASERSSLLTSQVDQIGGVPALIARTGLIAQDRHNFESGVRSILTLSGIVTAMELQPEGEPPWVISRDPGVGSGALAAPITAPLRPVGMPVVSVNDQQLILVQSVWSGDPSGSSRFWGYISARVSLDRLVDQLGLEKLTSEGFGVNFRFLSDPLAPPLDLYTNAGVSGGISRVVTLPQGSQLKLTVAAPSAPSSGMFLGTSLALLGVLLTFVLRGLTRIPQSPASPPQDQSSHEPQSGTLEREMLARQRAEEHLERSYAMLDSMLEHFPGLVVIKRASDLRITRVNRSGENILGRSRNTLIGRSSEEIYAPDFAERMLETDRQALAGGDVVQMPLERIDMPGQQPRWLHYRKLALCDRQGKPQYILEFGEDVTEREQLYNEMREHVHFVDQLLDAMPGPLFYKDAAGRYLGANAAFEEFIGKSREALIGRTVYDISPPHLASVYDEADKALLAAGGSQVYESQVTRADGSVAEVIFHKAVFRSTNGAKGGIVGFAVDISERKVAERRVAQLNRILTVLGETSQMIIQIHDRDRLLAEAGRLLWEKGGFPIAWIQADGMTEPLVFGDPATAGAVRQLIEIIGQPGKRACWPKNRLYCRRIDCCSADVAAKLAESGISSMIHLPLDYQGTMRGSIGILGAQADLFDEDENRLLEELATNLSHALDALSQEQARRTAEEKLQLAGRVFENNAEGIIVTDAKNRIVMVNKAFTQVTGYSADEVTGMNPSMLSSGRQDADFYRQLWHTLRERGEWRGEIVNRRKNGEYFPEWLTISVVRNESDEITNYVAVFADLTARKKVEERLNFLAHYDALTALPNRIMFTDRLDRVLMQADRAGEGVALLFLDLDRFSLINETIGHSAGDHLLREVSNRLKALVGENDSVSRLGGDHFAVFVSGLTLPDQATVYARRLQDALQEPLIWEGREIHVSASIGISVFPDDGRDSETLAMNADSAMYQAIADGGNTVRFFHQDMNERSSERVHIEGKLHHALERGEFNVYFQPFVDATTKRIIGGEALLRWHHPELGGMVSPATFIPLLEDTGLITRVGEWVLRCAAEEAVRWRDLTGQAMVVAVNLSAVQLADEDLPRKIGSLLDELRLDPACLEIELTESAVIRDAERGIRLLNEFKALGIQISMDDFGTGYSSLSYLKQLPISTLKIDRSFVMDTPGDPEAATIARAIIAMGHSLGLHIIAEGVESPAQVNFLRDAGADILQGFYFSEAIPADDFFQVLEEQCRGARAERPKRSLQLLAG